MKEIVDAAQAADHEQDQFFEWIDEITAGRSVDDPLTPNEVERIKTAAKNNREVQSRLDYGIEYMRTSCHVSEETERLLRGLEETAKHNRQVFEERLGNR